MNKPKVEFLNGVIEITDNSEITPKRADVSDEDGQSLRAEGLGGITPESTLKTDKKRTGWHEPHTKTQMLHKCPICGTEYEGRPNKKYCCKKCQEVGKKRKQRAKKREIANFKPYRGTAGQVYFLLTKGRYKESIAYVPAIFATTRAKAEEYLKETYKDDIELDDYITQVNEVIPK